MNSREKGKRGERDFRDFLRDMGFEARRGQQFAGGTDSPDVICEQLPHVHLEVKFSQQAIVGSAYLEAAWKQARDDADGKKTPIVAFRRSREQWKLMAEEQHMGVRVIVYRQHDMQDTLLRANELGKKLQPTEAA